MTVSSRNGRLTPDQVQSISFPPARFGRRGLDEETVHSFCDQVQHELMTLLNEKASLWEEVERLRSGSSTLVTRPVPARRTHTSRPCGSCRTPSRWRTSM